MLQDPAGHILAFILKDLNIIYFTDCVLLFRKMLVFLVAFLVAFPFVLSIKQNIHLSVHSKCDYTDDL